MKKQSGRKITCSWLDQDSNGDDIAIVDTATVDKAKQHFKSYLKEQTGSLADVNQVIQEFIDLAESYGATVVCDDRGDTLKCKAYRRYYVYAAHKMIAAIVYDGDDVRLVMQ